jgi:hypothetical protein
METTLKIVSDLSNVWNVVVLWVFIVVFCELELNLIGKEKLQGEIHNFLILL